MVGLLLCSPLYLTQDSARVNWRYLGLTPVPTPILDHTPIHTLIRPTPIHTPTPTPKPTAASISTSTSTVTIESHTADQIVI